MQVSNDRDIFEIISESIETSKEYLPRLTNGMDRVVELLRKGQRGEANALFSEATEGLEWLSTVIETIFRLPQLSTVRKDYGEKLEEFRTIIKNLMNAFLEQDFVLTGDIIEYELTENLEYWLDVFTQLDSILKSESVI